MICSLVLEVMQVRWLVQGLAQSDHYSELTEFLAKRAECDRIVEKRSLLSAFAKLDVYPAQLLANHKFDTGKPFHYQLSISSFAKVIS